MKRFHLGLTRDYKLGEMARGFTACSNLVSVGLGLLKVCIDAVLLNIQGDAQSFTKLELGEEGTTTVTYEIRICGEIRICDE